MNQPFRDPSPRSCASRRFRTGNLEAAIGRSIAVVLLAVPFAACSKSTSPDSTSTFQGALSLDSFPNRPDAVQATNELGSVATVAVPSSGDFRMELTRGHSYALGVRSGGDLVSVVFPRASGQLASRFDVASGAAVVSLGAVRYFASAPAAGFFLQSAAAAPEQSSEQADGELGECVDGRIAGTGAVCVDDDGDVVCEGEASDGDGECENGKDATTGLACTDPPEASDGDGECEDGKDSATGLPCDDPEDAVDPRGPIAVAEHNVPDRVGGCDEGGEEEDDD